VIPVVLRPAAVADLIGAQKWYGQQRPSLEAQFLSEIRSALASMRESPPRTRFVLADVRRVKVRRFPYFIYFREQASRIEVLAILHVRRDPDIWQKRL